MSSRALTLALLLALAGAAPAAAAGTADLSITQVVHPRLVANGQYVTYSLHVANGGPDTATGVLVEDVLSVKESFVGASRVCSTPSGTGATVSCALGTLAPGASADLEVVGRVDFNARRSVTATASVSSDATDPTPGDDVAEAASWILPDNHDHLITPYHSEAQVDFAPGESRTVALSCARPTDRVVDGSLRVDHVDQDTGTRRDVVVSEQRPVAPDTYRVSATNNASGRAQAKLFVVCLPGSTEPGGPDQHVHDLVVGPPVEQSGAVLASGRNSFELSCADPKAVAVAPGWALTSGSADLVASLPTTEGWRFVLDAAGPGTADLSIRCLNRFVSPHQGGTHELFISHPDRRATVPAYSTTEESVICSDEAKGLVAGFDLSGGARLLGHDPRLKSRAFQLFDDGGAPVTADLVLLCLGDRTATDPPLAAPELAREPRVTASSRSLTVRVSCPAGGCQGYLTLRNGARSLGEATVASHAGGPVAVRFALARSARGLRRVTAQVRGADGTLVASRTLRVSRR